MTAEHGGPGRGKSGMTLIEVSIAMAMTVMMCAGLYRMATGITKSSQSARLETEARSYASGVLEELIAAGMENLAKPSYTAIQPSQYKGSLGDVAVLMDCAPRVVWHAADGAVVSEMDASGFA